MRVLYQKYTIAFSSNTNLVFIVALKVGDFSIRFPSIFKVILHNFGADIVICTGFLLPQRKVQYNYFEKNWLLNDAKALRT